MRHIKLFFLGFALLTGSIWTPAQNMLNTYLTTAAENNPALKAKFSAYMASMEKIAQVGEMPDPTVAFGVFILPVETKNGPQRAKLSLSQRFPWWGSLDAEKTLAQDAAQVKYEALEEAKSRLFFEVKSAYYELYFVKKAIAVTEENQRLLTTFHSLVSTKIKLGQTSAVDALTVEMEIADLDNQLATLEDKLKFLTVKFNNLLHVNPDTPIKTPDTLPAADLPLSYEEVVKQIEANNHNLLRFDRLLQSYKSKAARAKTKRQPRITVGLDYINTGKRENTTQNGKDALFVKIGLNIPLYKKKYDALVQEAVYQQEMTEQEKTAKIDALHTLFEKTYNEYKDAGRRMVLFESQLLRARKAAVLLENEYSLDSRDFQEVIFMQRRILKYGLEVEKARSDKEAAVAFIQFLIGKL